MQCPECLSFNSDSTAFCGQCGAQLSFGRPRRRRGGLITLVTLVAGAALVTFMISRWRPGEKTASPSSSAPVEGSSPTVTHPPRANAAKTADGREAPSLDFIPAGWVAIEDRWEHEIRRFPAAVVSASWVAIPAARGLGGYLWRFRPGTGDECLVEAGVWQPGDRVGLWLLEKGFEFSGPELRPWDGSGPLSWLPLEGGNAQPTPIPAPAPEEAGSFLAFAVPARYAQDGVLVQGESVVGWTFAGLDPGGWLWNGDPGREIRHELWVSDFYRRTYAGGREELLAEAVGLVNPPPAERLLRLTSAFRKPTRLRPEETPEYVKLETITPYLLELGSTLLAAQPAVVADSLDAEVLRATESAELGLVALEANKRAHGPEAALSVAWLLLAELIEPTSPRGQSLLSTLRSLYADWIQLCLDEGDLERGWSVHAEARNRFPDDAPIHLRAVDLALAAGNWAEAERWLAAREYPLSLADRVKVLQAQISDLKGLEGRVVIRFRPGSSIIPTQATINGHYSQRFLVDTGASLTTIPTRTQQRLGIVLDDSLPQRRVSTAGGEVIAYEVVLDSVEIGGWEVRNLRAMVIDLANDPETGLLGLNFLNHFRMDLKSDEGLLTLEPR